LQFQLIFLYSMYRVLLYYKYVDIDSPQEFAEKHLEYCKNLGLRGRILIAPTERVQALMSIPNSI
jgi:UPF0176 protein